MNYQALNSRNIKIKGLSLLSLWLLLILPETVQALPGFNHGYVYSRAAITNDQGQYTWGRYNPENGEYLGDIAVAGDSLNPAQWRVMSGDSYRSIIKQKQDLHSSQPDLELISRADYESSDLLLASGQPMANKPPLSPTTAYVSILPETGRLIDDPQSLILAQYPVNPDITVGDNIVSILYQYRGDGIGSIHLQSPDRIGFKAAFTKDKEGNAVPTDEFINVNKFPSGEYKPVAPLEGVVIESAIQPGGGMTDETGHYSALWNYPFCPVVPISLSNKLTAKLYYKRFNPRQSSRINFSYTAQKTVYDTCFPDLFHVPFFGAIPISLGHIDINPYLLSFAIDRSYLSGVAQLTSNIRVENDRVTFDRDGGNVSVVDTTEYLADAPDNSSTISAYYDFDRDGATDKVQLGHLEDKPIDEGADACEAKGKTQKFVTGDPEEVQGVWLTSSGHAPENCQPDLTRVIDRKSYLDLTNQGLLSKIGAEDLRDTDIYVVRVSDGKLISERIGLNEYERKRISDLGEDRAKNQFFYTLDMRGSKPAQLITESYYNDSYFEEWQSVKGMNPELHQREADHVQPGDQLRIYAINRATGYMGHVDTTYDISSTNSSVLDGDIDPIIMGPPNLRIKVERDYKIDKGASASEDTITRLIGFEGASLTSDTLVAITTEWLDHEGRPLPESLQGAGYTGRIAILSGDKTLPNDDQGVYQFAIEPGQRLQVLQLPNALSDSEHFYIHVSGQPETGQAIFAGSTDNTRLGDGVDFKSTGQNPGILEKRPDHYVPFLVPVYDEESTELQTQAYLLMKETDPDTYDKAPDPIYKWVYRPEMQFTSYDLKIDEINNSQDTDGNGSIDTNETIDIFNQETPVITSESVIDILYNLSTTDLLPLDYFNAGEEKELIFKVGEQEIKASMGEDQEISFDDLSHLSLLNPDDFLSMRLYTNNDAGNILWEFAFAKILMFPSLSNELPIIDLSADDAYEMGFGATYLTELSEPQQLIWGADTTEQPVVFTPPYQTSATGVFNTVASLPTKVGAQVHVYAKQAGNAASKFYSTAYSIIAGQPHTMTVTSTGKTAIGGVGDVEVVITVRDRFNNLVEDGTAINIKSLDLTTEGNTFTTGGSTTLNFKGGFTAGAQSVEITAGNVSKTVSVNVHDIDFDIVMASEIALGQTVPVTVNATSTYGDLTGIQFDVNGVRAALGSRSYKLNSSGNVSFDAYVGEFTGEGRVFVAYGNKIKRHDFNVIDNSNIKILDNVIIAGVTGKGSFNVNGATYEYTGSTAAAITGNPGEIYTASLVDYLAPPMLPVLHFPMQRAVTGNSIQDDVIGLSANVVNASRVIKAFEKSHYAYELQGSSSLSVDYAYLSNITNFGTVFNLYSTGSGQVFSYPGLGLTLTRNNGQQLVLSRTDGTKTISVETESLAPDKWLKVAAHFIDGQLILQVGDSIYKSPEILAASSSSGTVIKFGSGVSGFVSELSLYDWDAEKIASFEDGSLEASLTLDANGKGALPIKASTTNAFASIEQRKYDYWKDKQNHVLFATAYAADDGCVPIDPQEVDSFGEVIDMGAAMARFQAECDILPKLKKSYVTIRSDAGVAKKAIAVTELAYYTLQYTNAKKAEIALSQGPQCVEGAVTGDVQNFASGTCDIITSFFLIGDLRDFALHSKYKYWDGNTDKFNYPVYVFSGLGIAASLGSLLGVGIPANTALAGLKTGAKVMTGPFMEGIAKHLMKQMDDDILNFEKGVTAIKISLPLLQVSAAVILMKDDAIKAYNAISNIQPGQIEGFIKYTKVALAKLEADISVADAYDYQAPFHLLEVAYAIDKDGLIKLLGGSDNAAKAIKALVEHMHSAQIKAENSKLLKNGTSDIKQLFDEGISRLGENIDKVSNDELLDIVADDSFLTALIYAQHIGEKGARKVPPQDVIDSIRRLHCTPSLCGWNGTRKESMKSFFQLLDTIATKHADKFETDEALGSVSDIIRDLGRVVDPTKADSLIKNQNTAKGAAESLIQMVHLFENGYTLKKAESKAETGLAGLNNHVFDLIMTNKDKKTEHFEIKNWLDKDQDGKKISSYLWQSLLGKVVKKDTKKGKAAGQLHQDLARAFKDPKNIDVTWLFNPVKGGDISTIRNELLNKIKDNPDRLKPIIEQSDNPILRENFNLAKNDKDKMSLFIREEVVPVISRMLQSGAKLTDIAQ